MNWRIGQYLEFEKKIGHITNIKNDKVTIRYFSYGRTEKGYSWQGGMNKKILTRLFKDKKVKTIPPEFIMQALLFRLKGGKGKIKWW